MQPTIHDVARLANTSKSTVSRYLNGQKVKKETEAALEQAIHELNFHRNVHARRLVMNKTFNIGIVVDNISNIFYSEIIRGMEQYVHAQEYNSVFYSWSSAVEPVTSGEYKQESSFLKLLHEGQVDGIIMLSFHKRSEQELEKIASADYPVVLIGDHGQQPNIVAVDVDNGAGIKEAMTYLYDQGHRRIAYISGPSYAAASTYRFQGYNQALESVQLSYDPDLVVSSDWSKEGGYEAMQQLLKQNKQKTFTAIICSNDETAIGAMRAAKQANLHIPDQLSIVGYDDIAIAAWVQPALTTIKQPFEQIGRRAAEGLFRQIHQEAKSSQKEMLALDQIDAVLGAREFSVNNIPDPTLSIDKNQSEIYLCMPQLIIRDSCAPPPLIFTDSS